MAILNSIKLKFKIFSESMKQKNVKVNLLTSPEIKDSNETDLPELTEKTYDYSNFKNIQIIGKGSFGSVVRANWRNSVVALKSFNKNETICRELGLLKTIDSHENILRFYGITKVETDKVYQMNKYFLILEYADSGTLNTYLNDHFNELNWKEKYKLAFQLVNAVSFLHDKNIIHRDLHANNILVHRKTIKLADFGLSKEISEESNDALRIFGVIPYIDPKHFTENYKLNKKSDVYSIGVLLWQISSGRRPFYGISYDIRLSLAIVGGKREEIIKGTPVEYSNLYTGCWKYEPNERPNIKQVSSILSQLINNE